MSTNLGLVRVTFKLPEGAWHGNATERLWAEPIGTGRYRLRNTPFFAFGVSAEDIVFADDSDEGLIFTRVSIASGHSSYRLKLLNGIDDNFREYWQPLRDIGCSYEEGPVLAIDVPPRTDIYLVYALLEAGASARVWDFEEGNCAHPLRLDKS